jgi:putative polyhydroxyalkanoate system protein
MAKIDIKRTHSLENSIVKTKIDALALEIKEKYSLKSKWENDTHMIITGTGIKKGSIDIDSGKVHVAIDLSFAASMLKGKIETKINAILDKELG